MHSSREIKYFWIRPISQEMQRNAYNLAIRKRYQQKHLTVIVQLTNMILVKKRAFRLGFIQTWEAIFSQIVVRCKPDSFHPL